MTVLERGATMGFYVSSARERIHSRRPSCCHFGSAGLWNQLSQPETFPWLHLGFCLGSLPDLGNWDAGLSIRRLVESAQST